VGVADRTYRAWKDQPEFRNAHAEAQRGAWVQAVGGLVALAPLAVRTLRRLLRAERDDIRLKAALGLLDRGMKMVELEDLLLRLEALEAASAGKRP
jgi:hypothetical protein